MSDTAITVVRSGLQTLVVDPGRAGAGQAYGVPIGGALDRRSARLANWLVGNPPDRPTLEMTLLGTTLRFGGRAQLALTGARADLSLNGTLVEPYETVDVTEGDVLSVAAITAGCRVYLAIGGTWRVPEWLGSRSALFVGGSYRNGALTDGATIDISPGRPIHRRAIAPREWWQPPTGAVLLPVYPGPELDCFSATAAARFFGSDWEVGRAGNRMGIRLDGPTVPTPEQNLLSSPVLPGTIQLPPGGAPLLLLADAQTTGGYPRIATVAESALDELGQLRPGQPIRFTLLR